MTDEKLDALRSRRLELMNNVSYFAAEYAEHLQSKQIMRLMRNSLATIEQLTATIELAAIEQLTAENAALKAALAAKAGFIGLPPLNHAPPVAVRSGYPA